jgi:hypothetical protein
MSAYELPIATGGGMAEIVDIVSAPSGRRWEPVVGPETDALLRHFALSPESTARIRDEALEVLASCVPPTQSEAHETGLAIGYVQSGKTMSFTTVAALARDNGYALVILIAGTSIPLLRQSTERLRKDLRLADRRDRKWLPVESDRINSREVLESLRDALEEWRDPSVSRSQRRTLLITTMKHHGHLRNVTRALQALDLRGLPALVIDDEGDQASLNAAVLRRSETTTYRRIKALRTALPHHSFLQYTATPQAPLLINIIDILSPRFAEVLTPGPDYVGGKHFFEERKDLVEVISDEQLDDDGQPPPSLIKALRLFFVGVAAGMILGLEEKGNRSMMIHPSQRTAGHGEYYRWVTAISRRWQETLDPNSPYPEDRADLLMEFRAAHQDLTATVGADLPPFEEIAASLRLAIRRTTIREVNAAAGSTPEIRWQDHYSWILVGGQAMDRGFTVEGLTVTYMPRGVGVGNADTVQQRARFFGYKRQYLGYCRIFVDQAARDAYERYVEHEEDVRRRLVSHRDTGAPLTEWKRAFLLDESLQPTRKSVLDIAFRRASGDGDWYTIKVPHDSDEAVVENNRVIEAFLSHLDMHEDEGDSRRSQHQRHKIARAVSLQLALAELLSRLQVSDARDSQTMMILQLLLSEALDRDPGRTCTVVDMSSGGLRERSLNKKGEILNLFQGAAPSQASGGVAVGDIYPGDQEVAKRTGGVAIQIHHLTVKQAGGKKENVPTVAVYVPPGISRSLLVQDQPAQVEK